MTTIINPRRINRTIVVERDSRTLTARVIDALDAPNGMAEMLADAEAARNDAQQAVTDAQVIKDGLLDDLTVTADTLAPGAAATAVWDGNAQLLTLGIPEGQPGDVSGMVRFDAAQTLTAPQQAQARDNIGAADSATAVVNSRTVTAGTGLTGGGDLTADRTIAADFATEAEALAGVATDKVMSPARVRDATDAAMDEVAWKRVGKVNVGTGAAVTLTGLDLTKETLIILSYIGCSATTAQTLRLRASEDGGASWLTAWIVISGSANWSTNVLRGALEIFPDPDNNMNITGVNTASAAGGNPYSYAPAELVTTGGPVFLPTCDTIEFSWSSGNFRATASPVPETDCIIIYQRG